MKQLDTQNEFCSYIRWLVGSAALIIVAEVVSVLVIDPYGLYRLVEGRFNRIKPSPSRYQNEIKLSRAKNLQPNTLILGNSRAEVGLDPEAPIFQRLGDSAFNLGLAGTSIGTAREQLRYLLGIGLSPKRVVVGLEFLDFIRDAGSIREIAPPPITHPVENVFWRFDSVFSITSLKDSIDTLRIQYSAHPDLITARGLKPLDNYREMAAHDGYYKFFRQRAEENIQIYRRKAVGSLNETTFDELKRILDLASRFGIQVNLIVYPYHAQILILFEESPLYSAFSDWKRGIVELVSQYPTVPDGSRIAFYDFSGFSPYNCEKIPSKGDLKSETHWYWEAGHFKTALGDIILERILSDKRFDPNYSQQTAFGVELNARNIGENQRRMVDERERCLQTYPELFSETKALFQSVALGSR